jgi:hypothetical protein
MNSLFLTVPANVLLVTWLVRFHIARVREEREYQAEVDAWRAALHARHAAVERKEIERTNSAQRPRPASRWLRAETSTEVSPSAINPRVGTVVPGPADPVTRCADRTSRRTPT